MFQNWYDNLETPGVVCVKASRVSLFYPTFAALTNSCHFLSLDIVVMAQMSWCLSFSWLYAEGQKCCLSLIRSAQIQCHDVFMGVFWGLNPSVAASLICLCHHWPTFMLLLFRLSRAPLCLCNKALTPSGFQRHLRGNSLQCVAESPGCCFPLSPQPCRNGKGPSDWQMAKDLPHFIACYLKRFSPIPLLTASRPSRLLPDTLGPPSEVI